MENKEEFSVFRKSNDPVFIQEVAGILDANQIAYRLSDDTKIFDPSFAMDPAKAEFQVVVATEDFIKANAVLEAYYISAAEQIPPGYYLTAYDNEELKEIILKKDEWNEFDYLVAKKLLSERGIEYTEEEIREIERQRLLHLATSSDTPEQDKNIIILGYIFAVFGVLVSLVWGFAILFSYAVSLAILMAKKQLPDGKRIPYFSAENRQHGRNILYLSILFTILWVIFFSI